eukprot:IDg15826t1
MRPDDVPARYVPFREALKPQESAISARQKRVANSEIELLLSSHAAAARQIVLSPTGDIAALTY